MPSMPGEAESAVCLALSLLSFQCYRSAFFSIEGESRNAYLFPCQLRSETCK